MKLQMQNFKVYQELRVKMEQSIQKQRKALKQSIQQYVATEDQQIQLRNPRRNALMARHLTERKIRRKIRRSVKPNEQGPEEISVQHEPQKMAFTEQSTAKNN